MLVDNHSVYYKLLSMIIVQINVPTSYTTCFTLLYQLSSNML